MTELQDIYSIVKKYDENVVFSWSDTHIIIMKKTKDTIDDEKREGIFDEKFAEFSATELETLAILDRHNAANPDLWQNSLTVEIIEDMETKKTIVFEVSKPTIITYKKIHINHFHFPKKPNLGVKYCKTVDRAYYEYFDDFGFHEDGCYYQWDKDGKIKSISSWFNNKKIE